MSANSTNKKRFLIKTCYTSQLQLQLISNGTATWYRNKFHVVFIAHHNIFLNVHRRTDVMPCHVRPADLPPLPPPITNGHFSPLTLSLRKFAEQHHRHNFHVLCCEACCAPAKPFCMQRIWSYTRNRMGVCDGASGLWMIRANQQPLYFIM